MSSGSAKQQPMSRRATDCGASCSGPAAVRQGNVNGPTSDLPPSLRPSRLVAGRGGTAMSTESRYVLPVGEMSWAIKAPLQTSFTWEYDKSRSDLLALYEKGK